MKEIFDILENNVKTEFDAFKSEMLKLEKENIFDAAYKINGYVQLCEFLTYHELDKEIGTKYARCLIEDGECVLTNLYEFYLHNEYESLNNWEDITDMIRSYCEGYYSDILEEDYENEENC